MRLKRKERAEQAGQEQPLAELAEPVSMDEVNAPPPPKAAAGDAPETEPARALADSEAEPDSSTASTRARWLPRAWPGGVSTKDGAGEADMAPEQPAEQPEGAQHLDDVPSTGEASPEPSGTPAAEEQLSSEASRKPRRRGLLRRLRPRAPEDSSANRQAEPEVDATAIEHDVDPLDEPWLFSPDEDTPAVACSELVKRFGEGETSVLALRGISLEFEARTFSAIMGPSGSGKSTLMHLLAGFDAPTAGTVWIGGVSLDGLTDRKRTALRRARVGFVFQAFNLLPVLSAQENIELPLRVAGARPDPYWVEELLRAFDLTERRSHRPAELSGGQQQRVAIARALVTQPNVVFADEPTGNIDSAAGEQVLEILKTCVREYGQTVVMVTHDPLAAAHAARVVFLADGEIVRDEQEPTTRRILDVLRDRS